jgi:archaellum component FlaC
MDDKRLERIESKLDATNSHLSSIDVTLASQHESLKYHIKRTELLEAELKPIKKHVDMVAGAFKLIGLTAALGAAYAFLKSVI